MKILLKFYEFLSSYLLIYFTNIPNDRLDQMSIVWRYNFNFKNK